MSKLIILKKHYFDMNIEYVVLNHTDIKKIRKNSYTCIWLRILNKLVKKYCDSIKINQ